RQFFRTLSTPVQRYLFAERSNFDITDNISFITEATYSKTSAKTEIEPFPLDTGGASPLFPGAAAGRAPIQTIINGVTYLNPFVPAPVAAAATDANKDGLLDIAFRKRLIGVATRHYTADRNFLRIVTGFEGKLFKDRWKWDLTYNFGRTEENQISEGQINAQNFRNALNAVQETPATGDINGNGVVGDIVCADPIARA